ncbi:uncharacterized protein LOC112513371 [Cynara cardunculus var. scolymus]|uniref:uncharacterized protein LOC112513371 n=1 Tax=Cynara cardunculus var. scolymus TaxID=59895 RepID=UPI000D625A74|nr:uncharacterized protein LOC112513371 [Cynara cardunculus var. scolymus]
MTGTDEATTWGDEGVVERATDDTGAGEDGGGDNLGRRLGETMGRVFMEEMGILVLKPRKKCLKILRALILVCTMVYVCARIPMHLFVIVSMQRSGSGWFETLLNSHMNVSSNGEIFGQLNRRQNVSSIIETLDSVYNLELLTSSSKNQCSAAIGFKWMLNQGLMQHPNEIVDYFAKRGVSVIFFLRRNMLRRLVSILANSYDKDAKLLNGVHVSHVHSHQEALTLSRYKPTINITSLESDLGEMESTVMKALDYFNSTRHIIVYYEDLIKNPSSKLIQVEEFLKVGRMKLSSQQVKIHKGALSEHINNWDDVNKTLSGTMYERFLRAEY